MADINQAPAPPPGFAPVQADSAAPTQVDSAAPTQVNSAVPPPPPGFQPIAPGAENPPDLTHSNPMSVVGDLATGLGKEAIKSGKGILGGVMDLSQKIHDNIPGGSTLVPQSGIDRGREIAAPSSISEPSNFTQKVGGVAEQGLEFMGGEEGLTALKKLKTVSQIAQHAPELIQLLEDYPKATKVITSMLEGATVGGAQGAVKGEADPKVGAKKGAIEGAEGGAIGGGVAEGIAELTPKIARLIGVGGQDFESGMAKAGRPAVADRNWKQSLETAKPIILDNIKPDSVKTTQNFVDQVANLKNSWWTDKIEPQITKWANAPVTTTPVAQQIQSGVTKSMIKHFPEDAAEMERMANNFVGNTTIGELANDLETFNAKLKSYYQMDPQARAAAGKTDGMIAGLESAADGMRDLLFKELEDRGEQIPAQLRKQYGALADVERVFTKRIPVEDREKPMNLAQLLAIVGGASEAGTALITGHPLAAAAGVVPVAVGAAARARQAGPSLIRQGLKAGAREGLESTAGRLTKEGVAAAGSQLNRGINIPTTGEPDWVRMSLPPDHDQHVEIHPEDVATAVGRGLKKVVE